MDKKKKIEFAIFTAVLILSLCTTVFLTFMLADDSYKAYPEGGTKTSVYSFYGSSETLTITEKNDYKLTFRDKIYRFFL